MISSTPWNVFAYPQVEYHCAKGCTETITCPCVDRSHFSPILREDELAPGETRREQSKSGVCRRKQQPFLPAASAVLPPRTDGTAHCHLSRLPTPALGQGSACRTRPPEDPSCPGNQDSRPQTPGAQEHNITATSPPKVRHFMRQYKQEGRGLETQWGECLPLGVASCCASI
jgi:hypothetical protein